MIELSEMHGDVLGERLGGHELYSTVKYDTSSVLPCIAIGSKIACNDNDQPFVKRRNRLGLTRMVTRRPYRCDLVGPSRKTSRHLRSKYVIPRREIQAFEEDELQRI